MGELTKQMMGSLTTDKDIVICTIGDVTITGVMDSEKLLKTIKKVIGFEFNSDNKVTVEIVSQEDYEGGGVCAYFISDDRLTTRIGEALSCYRFHKYKIDTKYIGRHTFASIYSYLGGLRYPGDPYYNTCYGNTGIDPYGLILPT